MRAQIASILSLIVGLLFGALGALQLLPPWLAWPLLGIGVLAAIFTYQVPKPSGGSDDDSAFVRGDASGSTFEDVRSNAKDFVHGNATESVFRRVTHRGRRHG